MNIGEMRALRESWIIAMQASKVPRNTIEAYAGSLRLYMDWAESEGISDGLDRPETVRRFLAGLAQAGRAAKTINVRLSGLRVFAQWAVTEGELPRSDLGRVEWAKGAQYIPDYITPEQRDALLAACAGRSFTAVRDAALIALMYDSMLRADEVTSIAARGDVDLRRRSVRVRRGKGGKERSSGFSPATAQRLDRYQRARARHPHAAADGYWLGKRGALKYAGVYDIITKRGKAAGLRIHPHVTRNGGAIEWKRRGGSTEGLMAIGGWTSYEMVAHYTRAAKISLALEEQQRLYGDEGGR